MGLLFVYILKSSFSLALFYLFYKLLLNHDTFHRFNRIMLLALIVISALLPLVSTTIAHPTQINHSFMTIEDMLIMQSMATVSEADVISKPQFTWYQIVVLVYFIGLLFFMMRNIWSIYSIVKLIKRGRVVEDNHKVKIIVHDKKLPPFSWLKYILISEKDFNENCADILTHEKAHISRHHSYDIIIADIFIFIQWFNPAAWLLKQELKNIHEFEADDMVLRSGVDAKKYQLLLIEKAVGPKLYSIANNFNHSSLKKRITMMLKKKSNPWARMKYIYVLPVAALAVTAFARPEVNDELERLSEVKISEVSSSIKESIALPEQIKEIVEIDKDAKSAAIANQDDKQSKKLSLRVVDDSGNPIKGAAVVIEGLNDGGITDKNGQFSINTNIGDVICISFVGKESLRFPVKESMMNMKSNLMMFDQVKRMDDVVVIGYGERKEKMQQGNDEDPVFMVVEEMPEFPGGMGKCMEYLAKNIVYPVKAHKDGTEGRVIVQFIISKDGSVKNPFVVRSVSPELDAEAIRVVKGMPNWTPGKQRGENVSVKFTIPISFKLAPQKVEGDGGKPISLFNGSMKLSDKELPLIIVDGKAITNEQMNSLDQKSIESISVNKEKASVDQYIAEYGEKAKNGVMIITTKKK
ncbi:TonB family protein [Phocaeicola paurosaccharolyticus]|uniref:TonB family protein n=1 Tax=Phocaeicola paurosaccharolyticus TaxID=732242 RepID=UPI002FE16288